MGHHNRWTTGLLATVLGLSLGSTVVVLETWTAVAQTTQDRKAEGDRLLNQGIQQYQTSQFEAALNSWQQALQIYREINDRQWEGNALGNLGLAYEALGNYHKAIEYQEQSLAIAA